MSSQLIAAEQIRSERIEPQPLYKDLPPAEPFPMDALCKFSGAALAIQRVIKAPDAICGQSILAGLALVAQAHADISIDGRRRPISCFFATVGETGERKSAVDDVAKWPHSKYERDLEAVFIDEHREWEMEHLAWKQTRDDGMKKVKGKHEKLDYLRELGDEPQAPPFPALLMEEPTYEGMIKSLQNGHPSIGLFTDEGGRFVGGHAMNSENALKTAAGMSSLWDRGEAKRTRSGDGHSNIYGKRVSIHLMIQGVVADLLMGNDIFREQGWLSRMLISWPESTVGARPYVEDDIFMDSAVKTYHSACLSLLEQTPLTPERNLDPPILKLSSIAKQVWIRFHDYCDKEAAQGGELEAARGLANKAPEHAARLAGVLSVMRGGTEISIEDIEAGITLANYYLSEAVRMADAGQIKQPLKDAEQLLQWILTKGFGQVYPSLVYQNGPSRRFRTKEAALKVIRTLQDHGWLIPMQAGEMEGSGRRQAWRVNRV
jgi:hypothetical protein